MRYPTRLRHGSVYLTRGTIFALTALLFLSARTISHAAGVVPGHVIVRLQTEDEIGGIENDYGSRSLAADQVGFHASAPIRTLVDVESASS